MVCCFCVRADAKNLTTHLTMHYCFWTAVFAQWYAWLPEIFNANYLSQWRAWHFGCSTILLISVGLLRRRGLSCFRRRQIRGWSCRCGFGCFSDFLVSHCNSNAGSISNDSNVQEYLNYWVLAYLWSIDRDMHTAAHYNCFASGISALNSVSMSGRNFRFCVISEQRRLLKYCLQTLDATPYCFVLLSFNDIFFTVSQLSPNNFDQRSKTKLLSNPLSALQAITAWDIDKTCCPRILTAKSAQKTKSQRKWCRMLSSCPWAVLSMNTHILLRISTVLTLGEFSFAQFFNTHAFACLC